MTGAGDGGVGEPKTFPWQRGSHHCEVGPEGEWHRGGGEEAAVSCEGLGCHCGVNETPPEPERPADDEPSVFTTNPQRKTYRLTPERPAGALALEAARELERALTLYPRPQHSPHEGYAVILEELDELWDEVKASKPGKDRSAMRKEAIQIAAMALRFVKEVCDEHA